MLTYETASFFLDPRTSLLSAKVWKGGSPGMKGGSPGSAGHNWGINTQFP